WLTHQRERWMRPDARRYVRPDWRRFVRPDHADRFQCEFYERKYSPDQPRDGHGRWTDEGASDLPHDGNVVLAFGEMGTLLGQAIVHPSRGGGKECFYQFSYGIVAVPWATNIPCSPEMPWFAVTHGRLIK